MTYSARHARTCVLVVDDDPDVLELAALMIDSLGCEAITSGSAVEALDLLRQNDDIEILFSDMRMPGMDGERLAEAARRIRPDLRVVLTSGASYPQGRFEFLRKPYRAAELGAVLNCRALAVIGNPNRR